MCYLLEIQDHPLQDGIKLLPTPATPWRWRREPEQVFAFQCDWCWDGRMFRLSVSLQFLKRHSLRLPSMSAWLFRVSTPCLYVTAFTRMGIAMKGLFPSVTLATRLLPPSHCSSTSSDRLFLSSSSSLDIKQLSAAKHLNSSRHLLTKTQSNTHTAHSSFSFLIELYKT